MKTLNISDETYERIKDQLTQEEQVEINSFQDFVGKKIFVRTVTYHLLGRVKKIVGNLILLDEASWIADSGRFMDFIKEGKTNEVEPVGEVYVNISSIVDLYIWKNSLPKEQK